MRGGDVLPPGRADAETLAEDRQERSSLHFPDARQGEQPALEVLTALRLEPDALRRPAVVLRHGRAKLLHAPRHSPREAVDRGLLAEELLELARVGGGDGGCVEAAEPPPDLERARERLLNRHLLVEDEADEQRQRLLGEKAVGFVVTREVQVGGPGGAMGRF